MTQSDEAGRLYDEREIGALIQKATELQEAAEAGTGQGLPLHEIERIAAEVGISPAHLRAAAVQMDEARERGGALRFLGGPYDVGSRRVVPGSVTDEQWDRIVSELRRFTGSTGRIEDNGQRREWTRTVTDVGQVMESTEVTLSSLGGATAVEVRSRFGGGARMTYLVSVLLGGGAAGIFLDGASLSDLTSTLVLTGGAIGGLTGARLAVVLWARRRRDQLARLAERLQMQIAPPASPLSSAPGVETGAGPERD